MATASAAQLSGERLFSQRGVSGAPSTAAIIPESPFGKPGKLTGEPVQADIIPINGVFLPRERLEDARLFDVRSNDPTMQSCLQRLRILASTDETFCLTGETGVGKTFLAAAVHKVSSRKGGPFVHVNCSELDPHLGRGELFGYVPGSFTGAAAKGREGLVAAAEGGTLFLDEIGDMPLDAQKMLLTFLDDRMVRPVGSNVSKRMDVRVICATNQDIEEAVASKVLRQDLRYKLRLSVDVPPLRERPQDLPEMIDRAFSIYAERFNKEQPRITDDVRVRLLNYRWPGNLRELDTLIMELVLYDQDGFISASDLNSSMQRDDLTRSLRPPCMDGNLNLASHENWAIQRAMEVTSSNIDVACKLLGIGRATLYRKLRPTSQEHSTTAE